MTNRADTTPITRATPGDVRPDPVIELSGVTAGYAPGKPVLEDVSAALRPGRVTVLLGPNASGKSSLLKVMLGQLDPWSGAVEVAGKPVSAWEGKALARRISYVPQRGGVSFSFSVREVVSMGRFAFGDHAFVEDSLAYHGLADVADRPFNELSGGQQQRVLIARAWGQSRGDHHADRQDAAAGPASNSQLPMDAPPALSAGRAVLADEPASSLDLRHAHETMARLRAIADEGLAVLVVLHGLELAARWADEVWLLHAGRLVAAGQREDVLRPEVLGPVYGVDLGVAEVGSGRQVFFVQDTPGASLGDTLNG